MRIKNKNNNRSEIFMLNHHNYLTVRLNLMVFIFFSACVGFYAQQKKPVKPAKYLGSNGSTKSNAVNDQLRQSTIEVFRQFYSSKPPKSLNQSQTYLFMQNEIQKLNLQNVDADLVIYFRVLNQKFGAFAISSKQMEKEIAQLELQEELQKQQDEDDDDDDGFGLFQDLATVLFSSAKDNQKVATFKLKWGPIFSQIEDKYDPLLEAPLKRLTKKYGYPFYSYIFGEDNDDTNIIPDKSCQGFVGKKQIIVTKQSPTGLKVCRGQSIKITATGLIVLGMFAGSSSPDGIYGYNFYNYVAEFNHGSLIYQIKNQENEKWEFAGSRKTFMAKTSGEIILAVNDKDDSNNSGKYTVTITVQRNQ